MNWQAFLDSLTTVGGRIFILLILMFWLVSMLMILHLTKHDPGEEGKLLLSNSFTALFSTMLGYLGGPK